MTMSKVDIYRYCTTVKSTDPTGPVTPTGVINPVEVIAVGGAGPSGGVPVYVHGRLVPLIAWLIENEGFDPMDIVSVMDELVYIETLET
jgi:hypothetical protein